MHPDCWATILKHKQEELNCRKRPVRTWELNTVAHRWKNHPRVIDLFEEKQKNFTCKIIAEYARTAPRREEEVADFKLYEPEEWARRIFNAGADAISVVCEKHLFQGKIEDVWKVHDLLCMREQAPPIICKDLILHPIQILECAEAGASAVTLHIEFLEYDILMPVLEACYEAAIETIVEVHNQYDIERAVELEQPMICVTGHDLKTGQTDWNIVERLIKEIPKSFKKLYAGGLDNLDAVEFVRARGVLGVFIGKLTHLDISENELEELFTEIKKL